jgi:hypothetical protein
VGELIDILSNLDENEKIYLSHDGGYTYGSISEMDIDEIWEDEEEDIEEDYYEDKK